MSARSAADRKKASRERLAAGRLCLQVDISEAIVDLLAASGLIQQDEIDDREADCHPTRSSRATAAAGPWR